MPIAQLDVEQVMQGFGKPARDKTVDGRTLTVAGKAFDAGLGTHANSELHIDLGGRATAFTANVGLDDETLPDKGSVEFWAVVDEKIVWRSGVMRTGDAAKPCRLDLTGARRLLLLVTDAGDGDTYDHADWAGATIEYSGAKPVATTPAVEPRTVLTPPASPSPRINGAKVYGARPGSPILFKVAASGEKPMRYTADGLPEGVSLDPETGILTGRVQQRGRYAITLIAKNARGEASRPFRLEIGDKLALTPPMGWNSWNVFGTQISQARVIAIADAMVESGLIDYGWSYINIDDAWSNSPASAKPEIAGPPRHADGSIVVNKKFPDMKGLVDHIHAKGLKAGIYSSPGALTCGGYVASFGFEKEDAEQFAAWGIDYLKYDWCGYEQISNVLTGQWRIKHHDPLNLQAPYKEMNAYLNAVDRDIVYSLCQYGWGDVWTWGESVGGELWRTTGDITDTWASMSGIGFGQAGHERFAGPGHWNDPDMLVVGKVGLRGNFWNHEYDRPNLTDTRLTPNEQYTHITLWTMLAAPLLIGCDLTQIDDFTRGLLTNAEVIDINQDPLGQQARRVTQDGFAEVWARPLEDGSVAIALFNRGPLPIEVQADLASCGVKESGLTVRDVWRQQDLGPAGEKYATQVPRHGVTLIRVYRK